MVSELVSLPLRLGARAARVSLYATEQALRLTAGLAEQVIQVVRPQDTPSPRPKARETTPSTPARPERPAERPGRHAAQPARPAAQPAPRRPTPTTPAPEPEAEPAHVSSQPTLVEELAEPGAEEGAGAEIRVEEPWRGYARLGAKDVLARLQEATAAELTAVELYERTHRARQTVLTAAERRLRSIGGSGS